MFTVNKFLSPFGIEIPKTIKNLFDKSENKEKVYVIGNGWGTYYFVKNLDKTKFEPIIIAPNKKVLNTPRLTNLLIDKRAKVEFDNPHGEIILDMLEDIDIDKKVLVTKSGLNFSYENKKIVLAIGSEPNDFGIEGVSTRTYKFKTIQDVNLIREKLSRCTINNQIYVVGSGITGVEIASKLGNIFNVKIIEGLGTILPGYNNLTKSIILKYLQNHKYLDIQTNTLVKSIGMDYVKINNTKTNKNIDLLFNNKNDLIIWSGGVRIAGYGEKSILFKKLNQIVSEDLTNSTNSTNSTNFIIKPRGIDVMEDFKIRKDLDIYCLGDMVANKGPPSAQNAKFQGEYLAKYFNSGFDKKFLKSNKYEIKTKGKLVHLLNDTYLESDYYSGFIPKIIDKLIEWINI